MKTLVFAIIIVSCGSLSARNFEPNSMMNVDEFARVARGDVPVTVDSSLDDEELQLYSEPTER